MLNNIKYITRTVTLLALSAFMSCAEMEDPQTGAVGYLAAPSLAVDVTVHDISLTKAAPALNAVDMPSAAAVRAEVKYVVKKKGSEDDLLDGKPWTEALTLPTGETYVVEAFYGDNEFDGPCLYGFQEITIAALETVQPNLNVKVSNSLLCVSTDPLDGHFTMTELFMKSGDKTRTLTKSESVQVEDTWIWVPAKQKMELEIMGTNSLEDAVSFTHSFTPQAGYAYNLISGKPEDNWPSITWSLTQLADGAFEGGLYFEPAIASNMSDANVASLIYQVKGGLYDDWTDVSVSDVNGYKYISGLSNDVTYSLRARVGNIVSEELSFAPVSFQSCFSVESVTAEHNNNGNADVELSSTTMTAGNMKVNLPAIIAGMATVKASGSFSSSTNAAAGSFSDVTLTSTAENVSFANVSDWPYLPQGTYTATVSATCTLNSATYTASSTADPKVPAPVFKVTLSAYTSYDKYAATNGISKSINDANNCDPSTLYNAGAAWSISEDLMKNPNYSKTIAIYIDDDATGRISTVTTWDYNCFYQNVSGLSWAPHTHQVELTFDNKTISSVKNTHHITGLPYTAAPPTSADWDINRDVSFNNNYVRFGTGGNSRGGYITYSKFYLPYDIDVAVSSKIDAYGAPINTTTYIEVSGSRIFECTSNSGAFNYKTVTMESTQKGTLLTSNNSIVAGSSYGLGDTNGKLYYINVNYR